MNRKLELSGRSITFALTINSAGLTFPAIYRIKTKRIPFQGRVRQLQLWVFTTFAGPGLFWPYYSRNADIATALTALNHNETPLLEHSTDTPATQPWPRLIPATSWLTLPLDYLLPEPSLFLGLDTFCAAAYTLTAFFTVDEVTPRA